MRSNTAAFGSGAAIGTLGGLIGLGGAEFRLPLLISMFNFRGLEAVILNKATSLIVVATALPFRARTVPFAEIGLHWPVILNLLAGSLVGAYVGASWATRLKSETLYKIIAVLLVLIAASTDAKARVDNQGIWACSDRFKTCIDWCRVYTEPAPLIACLTECSRNLNACLRAVTKQFPAKRSNLRGR